MQVEVNSYHDIGDYLREVRESLNLDLRNIGQQLNIRPKYLVALEEGKIDVMPGKVYARGYLMNYAEYLGLDKDELAEAFDRMGEAGKPRYYVPEPTGRNYQPGMVIVGLALVVVLAAYYFWYQNHNPVVPPDYERVSPVPERLLDPVVDEAGMLQENDDLYIDPMLPVDSSIQGDGNVAPQGAAAPLPNDAAIPDAQPMEVPASVAAPAPAPAPAAEPAAEAPESTPASGAAPAAEPEPALPWQRNEGGIQR